MHCILDDSFAIRTIAPNLETGPWIAGGTAMSWFLGQSVSRQVNSDFSLLQDIDVFCANEEQLKTVRQALINTTRSVECPFVTKNAETYKFKSYGGDQVWKIQLITCNFFDSAESLIDSFDFVCCGIATDGKKFVMLPGAGKDINSKTLRINRYNPNTILPRALKYWSMGWTPTPELIEKISNDSSIDTMLAGKGGEYDHAF